MIIQLLIVIASALTGAAAVLAVVVSQKGRL